jgi:predicted nucleotidyltransferase
MIDVPQHQLFAIKQILLKHIPAIEVRAFGSRVSGTAKPYSDLDLVIMGEQKIDPRVLAQLKEDFEESDIPFRVEILDWCGITDDFKKIIEQCCEVL